MTPADICLAACKAIGEEVVSSSVLGGGKNSRVFLVTTPTRKVVVKHYYSNPNDPRDRQMTEYGALTFLASKGVACVPEVLHLDRKAGVSILAHIEGERITDALMSESDEQDFLAFVKQLKAVSAEVEADQMNPASEAFFTLEGIVGNIKQRLARLEGRSESELLSGELNVFLGGRFIPALSDLLSQAKVYYRGAGLEVNDEIALADRVLSPSDFGLHNCIKSSDGLVFLDLEYFGWDDPVKLVSDFTLHPAQGTVGSARYRVAGRMVSLFKEQPGFVDRLKALLPLFGLKWCLIMLNEFLAGENARRVFSGNDEDYESVLERQLGLAEAMLEKAVSGDVVARLVEQN